jgi:DNA-nicking Smr family endonuclease
MVHYALNYPKQEKPMSTKKSKFEAQLSEEDLQFFRNEVADVRPLKSEKRIDTPRKYPSPKPRRSFNNFADEEISTETVLSDPDLRDIEVEDALFYARPGIQQKVQRKLRRGELEIEDELDLHGYTVIEAKSAIIDFIEECKRRHIRYIRIIHGKGFRSEQKVPVLKTHVAYWLPQLNDVLAFASARPNDGGTGALYVILKSVR